MCVIHSPEDCKNRQKGDNAQANQAEINTHDELSSDYKDKEELMKAMPDSRI